ncbi:MAG TPA: cation diffusion facilitator family transporter [Myxococcaceae bacterium]
MHASSVAPWTHSHRFLGARHDEHARRTSWVVALTVGMMLVEVVGGLLTGSMALLADGLHMSTHALAIGIATLAYAYAKRHVESSRFAFGTGKVGDLAGFASAILLGVVAIGVGIESVRRFISPVPLAFAEALPIACVGLLVNLVSAVLLHEDEDEGAHDNNLRAAYVHVIADAATSVLAIAAILGVRFLRWSWLDPAMGLVGAALIASWSISLLRRAGGVLLDLNQDAETAREIRRRLETDEVRVSDLHVWQIGPGHKAAVISVVTHEPQAPQSYKAALSGLPGLSHVTVEVQRCPDAQV